jgi:hypothetical protein
LAVPQRDHHLCASGETIAGLRRCVVLTGHDPEVMALIDRLQAVLDELREALAREDAQAIERKAVEAFADETFRDRDA